MAKKIRVWDGTQWQDVAPSLPYTAIHSAQASMPLTGVDGQVWLDTDGTLAGQDFVPLSGGTMTGNLNVPSINSGGIAGQNYFINGGLDIWQRGTSFQGSSGSSVYIADRWKSYDISATSRSTDVPSGQNLAYSIIITAGAGGSYPRLQYRMPSEDAAMLAGKTVTFSFWAKNGGGTATFFAEQQIPTVANSFDGGTNNLGGPTFATSGNFSTSWQRYTWTTTVHATTATNGMTFHIVRDPSSASTTYIAGLKMEIGNQATTFSRMNPSLQTELAACQRYYETSYNDGVIPANGSANGGAFQSVATALSTGTIRANGFYKVKKRVNPSVTLYRTSGGTINNSWTYYGGSDIDATSTSASTDQKGFYVTLSRASSFTLNNSYLVYGDWAADAEL